MIIKLIGSLLVIGSSSLLGLYFAGRDDFRISDLTEWKKALLILRSEIAYSSKPLAEAAEHIGKSRGPAGESFAAFADHLARRQAGEVSAIWQSSIEQTEKKSYLSREDNEFIKNFGGTLGSVDKAMQLNAIDLTIEYINNSIDNLRVSSSKNKKMYASLGILSGLLIVAVLF